MCHTISLMLNEPELIRVFKQKLNTKVELIHGHFFQCFFFFFDIYFTTKNVWDVNKFLLV